MAFIIVLVVMLVFMYFLLIRPQRSKQRQTQDMLSNLKPGDEVITIGGIYGDVVEVEEDKVVLEIAEDVHIEVTRRAIANIVPQEIDEPEEDRELEQGDDEQLPSEPESEPARSEQVEERTR